MRILHISDLHIGNEGDVDRWKRAEKIVRRIIRAWGDDGDRPLVLITGDIVDDGTEVEYIEARRILRPLHRAGFQVAPLPGNHDYGWNGAHAQEKRFKLFKKYLFGIETRVTYPDVPYADDDVSVITLNSMHAETGFWEAAVSATSSMSSSPLSARSEKRPTESLSLFIITHFSFQTPRCSRRPRRGSATASRTVSN
jgi:3',5'-cyclic AMP phosphodiesterase CpdA